MTSRPLPHRFALRRFAALAGDAWWALVVLGGVAFFFWVIWSPPL